MQRYSSTGFANLPTAGRCVSASGAGTWLAGDGGGISACAAWLEAGAAAIAGTSRLPLAASWLEAGWLEAGWLETGAGWPPAAWLEAGGAGAMRLAHRTASKICPSLCSLVA